MTDKAYPVTHTDEEWKKLLTPEQYMIMRGHGSKKMYRLQRKPIQDQVGAPIIITARIFRHKRFNIIRHNRQVRPISILRLRIISRN